MKKRIVVTGLSVLTPIGDNLDLFFSNLVSGKSAISKIRSIDVDRIECKVGGDLGHYEFETKVRQLKGAIPDTIHRNLKKIGKTAPFATRLGMLTAVWAYADAGLFPAAFDPDRMAGILGGSNFNDNYGFQNVERYQEDPDYISPLLGLVYFDTDGISSIAETLMFTGPTNTVGASCASSGIALRDACNFIRAGEIDLALVGGGVLDYSAFGLNAMSMLNVLGYRGYNDAPERASRPFDVDRNGFLFSHGSGMIIVEELGHALKRGAHIYAEIGSVASQGDANHLPNPSSKGQIKAMTKAIEGAGIAPEKIGYINAHATSTKIGDIVEINSIKSVFGPHAYNLKINAPKSILGHTGFSAHVLELIDTILEMDRGVLHPSINVDNLDPEIDLDVCANKPFEHEFSYALNNSFGIGGINCCTVVKKFAPVPEL